MKNYIFRTTATMKEYNNKKLKNNTNKIKKFQKSIDKQS